MSNKYRWTEEEINLLHKNYEKYHDKYFHNISEHLPNKTIKQAQGKWIQVEDPKLNNSRRWTTDEDNLLIKLFNKEGSQWKNFVKYFEGRSSVYIRNRYNLLIKKEKIKPELNYIHEQNKNIEKEFESEFESEFKIEIEKVLDNEPDDFWFIEILFNLF
jgi:hypothetical protein